MNIYDVANSHKSIRKFKKSDVSNDLLKKIAENSIKGTSSSGNMQTFSIIITKDEELKKELYPLHFNQEMVLEAPVLVTFCSDFSRMRKWLEINEAKENFDNFMSFMIGSIDATLVSQTFALLAESEGLGICYMGTTLANCKKIGKLLNLPQNVVPVVGFVLGYPDEEPSNRDRLPLEGLVHFEKYNNHSKEEISEIYKEREEKGWDRYMSIPELKKLVEENKVNNLAQIYTTIKYTKESHIEYSNTVLNYLKEQNFFNN
ncbi:MAG: nitroreductase family protein [Candidatus Sericytochromatia bacterium]